MQVFLLRVCSVSHVSELSHRVELQTSKSSVTWFAALFSIISSGVMVEECASKIPVMARVLICPESHIPELSHKWVCVEMRNQTFRSSPHGGRGGWSHRTPVRRKPELRMISTLHTCDVRFDLHTFKRIHVSISRTKNNGNPTVFSGFLWYTGGRVFSRKGVLTKDATICQSK